MLPRPIAIRVMCVHLYILKSFKGPAQDFLLGIGVKSQESIWDACNHGAQIAFH